MGLCSVAEQTTSTDCQFVSILQDSARKERKKKEKKLLLMAVMRRERELN